MNIFLKELSINDGILELECLRNIPYCENGFYNPADEEDLKDEESFKKWLNKKILESKGVNIKEGHVPQTIYWIINQDQVVGVGKVRHYLNENLIQCGGLIGLGILNNCRCKGIGTESLNLLLAKAREFGIVDVLLTINEDNLASRRVAEKCGCVLDSIDDGQCKYWIKL